MRFSPPEGRDFCRSLDERLREGTKIAAVGDAGSTLTLRELNRLRVVDALRRGGSASRSDLARVTGLSRTTVAALVADLQASGLVVGFDDEPAGSGTHGRGRPPMLLRLDASRGRGARARLRPRPRPASPSPTSRRPCSPSARWSSTSTTTRAGRSTSPPSSSTTCWPTPASSATGSSAAGMGAAGPDRPRDGARRLDRDPARAGPGSSRGRELARGSASRCRSTTTRTSARSGEVTFGAGRGPRDVVYVMVSSGIGAGLVLDGRLYRGATGIAGELGHVRVRRDGAVCRCGNRGCLETVAAVPTRCSRCSSVPTGRTDRRATCSSSSPRGDRARGASSTTRGARSGASLAGLCNILNPTAVDRRRRPRRRRRAAARRDPRVARTLRAAGGRGGARGEGRRARRSRRGARRARARDRRHRAAPVGRAGRAARAPLGVVR